MRLKSYPFIFSPSLMSIQLILILEILEIIAIFFECIMVFILYGFPIRIEPLTLLCPLFCCLQRMSLEKFEINGYREDTVACFHSSNSQLASNLFPSILTDEIFICYEVSFTSYLCRD